MMKHRAVIQIDVDTYLEQQHILTKFPNAVWISVGENRMRFYVPFQEYNEVKKVIEEWEIQNG